MPGIAETTVAIAGADSQIDGPSGHRRQSESYSGWINEFCVEPKGDVDTCCLGWWLPGVLYGRIDERLKAIKRGDDPIEVGNGCNGSCCIWTASFGGFCGGMTAVRRTRVRGVYGIEGKLGQDCVSSVFCNQCILMQQDREIRAREGQDNLRTNPEYIETAPIDSQPHPPLQMRYVSPRETNSSNQENGPSSSRSNQQQLTPNKLQKSNRPLSKPSHRSQETTKGPSEAYVSGSPALLNIPSKKRGRKSSRQKVSGPADTRDGSQDIQMIQRPQHRDQSVSLHTPMKLREGNKVASSRSNDKHDGGRPQSNGQENKPSKVKGYSKLSENEQGESTLLPEAGSDHKPTITKEKGLKSFLNTSVHDLADCFKHDSSDKGTPKVEVEPPTPHHNSIGSSTTEVVTRPAAPPSETHILAECTEIDKVITTTTTRKSGTSDHTLTDCETIVVADETTTTHSPQELSYVHDFTDCPVDKGILEYYEKEEEKAQAHALEDCTRASSTSQGIPREVQQHGLDERHRASSATVIVPEEPPQYSFPDCCRTSISSAGSVQEHGFSDCKRRSSTIVDLMKEIEEHGLVDCNHVSSTITHKGEAQPRELPDCCQDESQSSIAKAISPLRLSECTRASSTSAAMMKQPQQHRLDDCTRSSSLSVLAIGSTKQHGLSDCSRLSSTAGSQPQNSYISYAHEIEDCNGGQRSNSSSNSEDAIEQSPKKVDKGKKRADDHICQPYEHVTFKEVENRKSKLSDVTFVEDRTKSRKGKGKGKTYIPHTDGGKSARPSRTCEHSAEHTLAQILTAFERSQKESS